ncbi:dynein light chain axonemal [Labeo rohita]|uniref:Dynein axonemal light chain 1 n=1 Tax=Labeo rohita TaxID=84645 RepID=A0A498MI70_LABRO|nr:dynein light chain axonemal [Labeo rohita]
MPPATKWSSLQNTRSRGSSSIVVSTAEMLNCPREAVSNPQGIRDAIEHAPVELRQQSHSDMSPLGIQPRAYLDRLVFPKKAKATTIKEALVKWEEKTGEKASEATAVKLYGQIPPIEKMDASLSNLVNCERLSLSTNCIEKIANLNGLKNLKILSLGRNNIKNLNGLEAVGDTLEELWISYNLIEKLKGIHVMKKLKVLYMSNNLVKEWDMQLLFVRSALCHCGYGAPWVVGPRPPSHIEEVGSRDLLLAFSWVLSTGNLLDVLLAENVHQLDSLSSGPTIISNISSSAVCQPHVTGSNHSNMTSTALDKELERIQALNGILEAYLDWKLHEHLFWCWMDSVIDSSLADASEVKPGDWPPGERAVTVRCPYGDETRRAVRRLDKMLLRLQTELRGRRIEQSTLTLTSQAGGRGSRGHDFEFSERCKNTKAI